MDARSLAFDSDFACVLCPYSLITYMTMAEDLHRLVDETVRVLRPGGILVADAFIPRDSAPCADYRLDYQRPCFDGILSRSKRVTAVAPDINRIERHYEVRDAGGAIIDLIDTVEDIRTFTPENLAAAWRHPAMHIEATLWDYHAQPRPAAAQFCTLILRKAAP
jgi:hypothetical protein